MAPTTIRRGSRGDESCPQVDLVGHGERLEPGYYAVSASAPNGLPWRYYGPVPLGSEPRAKRSAANGMSMRKALRLLPPRSSEKTIGHWINIYRLGKDDAARLDAILGVAEETRPHLAAEQVSRGASQPAP